jgi:hypothetical protein
VRVVWVVWVDLKDRQKHLLTFAILMILGAMERATVEVGTEEKNQWQRIFKG